MEIQLWKELLAPYQLAVNELMVKFNYLIKEHRSSGQYSPIEEVNGRVKKISSILEKMQKKKIKFEDIETKIEDIAGIRIICQFVEDIDTVVNIIKNRSDMIVKEEKDYISNSKPSGYRSYHLIVYYDVITLQGTKRINVEIQIRTLAMNFWATIEHSLKYKYEHYIPETLAVRLRRAADAAFLLDQEMSEIREDIMKAQVMYQVKSVTLRDVLDKIQELYNVGETHKAIIYQRRLDKVDNERDITEIIQLKKEIDSLLEEYKHKVDN